MPDISVHYERDTKSWLIYRRPFRSKELTSLQALLRQLGLRRNLRLERELRDLLGNAAAMVHVDVFTSGLDRCTVLGFLNRTDATMALRSRRLDGEEFASVLLSELSISRKSI